MNMELPMTTANQMTHKPAAKKGAVLFVALFRLALLVGPEALIMKTLAHSPVLCVLAGLVVLGLWLTVDVWPFRPATAARPATRQTAATYAQNLTKAQWWSYLFCRMVIIVAIFHSKLTV